MSLVVSDTSPIRALHHLNLLGLLPQLFDQILLPPAVLAELERPQSRAVPVPLAQLAFAEVRTPADAVRVASLRAELDAGESEAIALALEIKADLILMDESEGRRIARAAGLMPIGVAGILAGSKERGLVAAVGPLLARLRQEQGFFLSDAFMRQVLSSVGE